MKVFNREKYLSDMNTIYNMILLKPKTKKERKNGGRTSPAGWGFDYLFDNRQME